MRLRFQVITMENLPEHVPLRFLSTRAITKFSLWIVGRYNVCLGPHIEFLRWHYSYSYSYSYSCLLFYFILIWFDLVWFDLLWFGLILVLGAGDG